MVLLTLAILLDMFIGDPPWLWRRVPHPVVLFGSVISFLDKRRESWNIDKAGTERGYAPGFFGGFYVLIALGFVCLAVTALVGIIGFLSSTLGFLTELVLVAVLIAQKSLYDHVKAVLTALQNDGLEGGRTAVSMIVGRDVSTLDEGGVSKAAIESLAENFSDGVVAPVLWYVIWGLPGILFYKAVNTADSMIGHRNEKYEQFGKISAKLDDVMNWPAARLAALLVVVVTAVTSGTNKAKDVWRITRRDAPQHRSPNAGWPETSVAVALGISLGGPRRYGDQRIEAVTLHKEGRNEVFASDIEKALSLLLRSCFCLLGFVIFLWLFAAS